MHQALTLARPYARAAFAIARDGGRLVPWSDALAFSAQVAADARVVALLPNPTLGCEQAVALVSPQAADPAYLRFLGVLADARRLALLPEIAGFYEQQRAEAERFVEATVTTAIALPPAELDKLAAALKQRFGCDVKVTAAVDPSLIGGAVIDAGAVVIDGSLKGKLARLQSALAH